MMKYLESKPFSLLPYLLIAGLGLLRLQSTHTYNMVPVFSTLLFFAVLRPAREYSFPLLALIGVDIFLTTHQYSFPLTIDSIVTWGWYLIVLVVGPRLLRGIISWRHAAAFSLLASISYFLVSNYFVWAEWNMYPKTLTGMGACYLAALPFFRNSLISESLCSVFLFGLLSPILQRPMMSTVWAIRYQCVHLQRGYLLDSIQRTLPGRIER